MTSSSSLTFLNNLYHVLLGKESCSAEKYVKILLGAYCLMAIISQFNNFDFSYYNFRKTLEACGYFISFLILTSFFLSYEGFEKKLFLIVIIFFSLGYFTILSFQTLKYLPIDYPHWNKIFHRTLYPNLPLFYKWLNFFSYHTFVKYGGRINFLSGVVFSSLNSAVLWSTALGVFLYSYKYISRRSKISLFFSIVILSLAVLFSYTRATVFPLCASSLVVVFFCFTKKNALLRASILFIIGSFFFVFVASSHSYQARLGSLQRHFTQYKFEKWKKAQTFITHKMSKLDYLVGIGHAEYYNSQGLNGNIENQYIQEFVDKGVLGILIYISLLVSYFYVGLTGFTRLPSHCWHRGVSWGLIVFTPVLIIHTLFESQYRSAIPWLMAFMAAIIVSKLKQREHAL
ncbi:MAG: hypothetical protein HYS98_02300 [Deltaproteobacteria bacterium]|nr:hypothetical protein [Deltaproteobacteria bacterium]